MQCPDLENKVAIVTGGAMNIGRDYCRALAAQGTAVIVADVADEGGQETTQLIEKDGGRAAYFHVDITDEAETSACAAFARDTFGGVDILVNNAALWGGLEFGRPEQFTADTWRRVIDVNVNGMWMMTKAVVPTMIEAGGGVIVNQSSIGAYVAGPMMAHYCTSKGAVNALTKALAKDLGENNIRVNAIAPGVIAVESTLRTSTDEILDGFVATQCVKRRGGTDDLVGPLLFLASDASQFMSGQVLVVDGGLVLLG